MLVKNAKPDKQGSTGNVYSSLVCVNCVHFHILFPVILVLMHLLSLADLQQSNGFIARSRHTLRGCGIVQIGICSI